MTMNHKKQSKEIEYVPLDDNVNFFYTFDLGLSAALVCAGFELVSLDKEVPRKVQFIFKRSEGIDVLIDDFWADRCEVKARAYFDTIKMIKNRLYSE